VRYHQIGIASGWIEVDGVRTVIDPDGWVCTRDHSWGVRYGVGHPLIDAEPPGVGMQADYEFFWSPSYLQRADGSHYAIFLSFNQFDTASGRTRSVMSAIEHPDGRIERIVDIEPELEYHPVNRRLLGGRIVCRMADGSLRPMTIEVLSDTGFHLGAGLYFGFEGQFHGGWRGRLHVDGERIIDCSTLENAKRLHQIRDTAVRISDPVGGGVGWGNWQPMMVGKNERLGLKAEDSFS
jgi:hypothetical protein